MKISKIKLSKTKLTKPPKLSKPMKMSSGGVKLSNLGKKVKW
jgi:hypothetical protein